MENIKRICDKCANLTQSACRTNEYCWAIFSGSRVIKPVTKEYTEKRLEGNINHCKVFSKID